MKEYYKIYLMKKIIKFDIVNCVKSLFETEQIANNQPPQNKDKFLLQIQIFLKRPVYIENYFRLWFFFSFYATCKFILVIPFQILKSIIASVFLQRYNRKFKSNQYIYTLITLSCFLIFSLDLQIFDMSSLYHTFRSQSTLKFYGLMFGFQVSEKLLTQAGKPILEALRSKIDKKINSTDITFYWKELICFFIYLLIHTYSIYLEFTVFIVVVNSDVSNFIIYIFVMNLTKMKSTAFKKFDDASYRSQINYDMKDRMQKIIYIILLIVTQNNRAITRYVFKFCFIFFLGNLIEWIKHTTVISLSQKKIAIQQLEPNLKQFLVHQDESSIWKCIKIDYNLFPLSIFILKMLHTIYNTETEKLEYESIETTAMMIICYIMIVPVMEFVINYMSQIVKQK